jgi:DNA invertase Pin-like site-specific DNA recombinase
MNTKHKVAAKQQVRQAILWGRYSSDAQGDGNSRERQEKLNRALAAREGIQIVKEYFDEGTSVKEGATPMFKRMLSTLPKGVGIIAENLDRINRGHPWRAKAYIADILDAGHFIYTSQDGRLYTADNLGELETLVIGDMSANVAYAENAKRLMRVREAVNENIALVRKGIPAPLGNWLPAHLKWNPETRQYVINKERQAVYQAIFEDYAKGMGTSAIAKKLNDNGTPTLGRGKIGGWFKATVREILPYEGVIGVLNIKGETILNAFPPAITEELFYKVQELLKQHGGRKVTYKVGEEERTTIIGGRHGNYTNDRVNNVFRGLCRCAKCGSSMRVAKQKDYIFCTGYWDDGKNKNKECKGMVKFTPLEHTFIRWFVPHAKEALLGKDESFGRVDTLSAKKNAMETRIEATMSLLDDESMPVDKVKSRLANLEAERKKLDSELSAAKAENSNKAHLPEAFATLDRLIDDSLTDHKVRAKIAAVVPNIIRCVKVDISDKVCPSFTVELVNGGELRWEYTVDEFVFPIVKGKKGRMKLGKSKVIEGHFRKDGESEAVSPEVNERIIKAFRKK